MLPTALRVKSWTHLVDQHCMWEPMHVCPESICCDPHEYLERSVFSKKRQYKLHITNFYFWNAGLALLSRNPSQAPCLSLHVRLGVVILTNQTHFDVSISTGIASTVPMPMSILCPHSHSRSRAYPIRDLESLQASCFCWQPLPNS